MKIRPMKNKQNSALARIVFFTVSLLITLSLSAHSQVVYQADFNGSGTATGGTTNIATFGGTATLFSYLSDTASIGTASPLFPGELGYLQVVSTGTGNAGVTIKPSSPTRSPDGWFVLQTGTMAFDTFNGGLDFYFTSSKASSQWASGNEFRPLDTGGGNGGTRVIISSGSRVKAFVTEKLRFRDGVNAQHCSYCQS